MSENEGYTYKLNFQYNEGELLAASAKIYSDLGMNMTEKIVLVSTCAYILTDNETLSQRMCKLSRFCE